MERLVAAHEVELEKAKRNTKPEELAKHKGQFGVGCPMEGVFLDPRVIANPLAMQVIEAEMGKKVFSLLPYGTNTSWPQSGVQHLHRDTGHLFPETPHILPATLIVVNIPLMDFTVENGATEAYPGSHLVADGDLGRDVTLEERAATMPSVRVESPLGSLVVRDMRVWHRGMPNRTDKPRSMIALVYFRQLHHLPDSMVVAPPVPRAVWERLSDAAKQVYRYNPIQD